MRQHADILDQSESLRMPVLASVAFHVTVFGALALSTYIANQDRENFGSTQTQAGDAVAVTSVKTIPLPSRSGHPNPVANDTESTVRQTPKQETKKQAKLPEPDAIPMKSKLAKEQPKPVSQQKYQPKEPPAQNQVFATQAPAAVNPMFMKAGAGGVGLGENTVLGSRFGGYADLVIKRVSDKWQTNGLAGMHTAPLVIVTFDIQRDGSIRNPQIAQRSGNSTLDYSALRAVMDAAPFPQLPPDYGKNQANVELKFQLQK